MNSSVHIASAKMDALLLRMASESPKLLRTLVKAEAGLLARDVVRILPPSKVGIGKRAVAADIHKVFLTASAMYRSLRVTDPDKAKAFWKAIRANDYTRARDILGNNSSLPDGAGMLSTVDVSMHRRARNNKGRVVQEQPSALIVEARSVSDYIRTRQGNVGYAKSPWGRAANALGQRVPAWILKTNGPGILEVDNAFLTPSVTIGSRVDSAADHAPLVRYVLKGREGILTAKIEKGLAAVSR